jgi:hypothetical protein
MTVFMTPGWRAAVAVALQGYGRWRDRAACRDITDPDVFHPVQGDDQDAQAHWRVKARRTALSYCAACPVRRECLVEALVTQNARPAGIWGGTRAAQREPGSTHPEVVAARAAIEEVVGGEWDQSRYVDWAVALRLSEGEAVPSDGLDRTAAIVRAVSGGRTFEETAADLGMQPDSVQRSWSRARAGAVVNGEAPPQSVALAGSSAA